MFRSVIKFLLFTVCLPVSSEAVEIYAQFPKDIHSDERYVIYSHGRIVEGNDPKPTSAEYGVYDFPRIKSALFEGGGFNLIAVQRPKNDDRDAGFRAEFNNQVNQLESYVRKLLDAGVKPSRITIVGFSRGGQLTAYASSRLAAMGINTAILAICSDGDFASDPPLALGGNFLSIYEISDVVGSCAKLAKRSHLTSFKEVSISTGKKHGAFFQPLPEWIQPLKAWIANTNR
jgi:Phospholipase/Carboxylesterase